MSSPSARRLITITVTILLLAASVADAAPRKRSFFQRVKGSVARVFRSQPKVIPRASDVRIKLPDNHLAGKDALTFVSQRLEKSLPQKSLDNHVTRLRHRKLSVAFKASGGKLRKLDLQRLVAADSAQALRGVLTEIEAKPTGTWMTHLGRKYNNLKASSAAGDRALAEGVLAVYRKVEQQGGGDAVTANKVKKEFVERFSAKLLKRYERVTTSRYLPRTLPGLPTSEDRAVMKLVKDAGTRGNTQRQLSYLERQAARLRGSLDQADRALGDKLVAYLKSYKQPWSEAFLTARMRKFGGGESPVSWDLTTGVEYKGQVNAQRRTAMKRTLNEAWTIIRGVVHPDILRKLPAVTVVVEESRSRAVHSGHQIKLGPKSNLKTVLHEFGHHIEDFAGVKPLAAAQAMRQQRAYTTRLEPLKDIIKGSTYNTKEKGYRGGYADGFMSKHYSGGYTEILSMGLQAFRTPAEAVKLFNKDGDMMLKLLMAIQNKP